MAEYICREAILDDLEKEIEAGNVALDEDVWINKGLKIAIRDIKDIKTADVQPVNQWISVKEQLPEIGRSVLIYYPKWDGDEIQVAKLEGDGMMFDICGEFNIGTGVITHWMPLPKLPKDGEESG